MTLDEFLLARIAEDEAMAANAASFHGGDFERDDYGCLRVQPARELAECASRRAILTLHDRIDPGIGECRSCGTAGEYGIDVPCDTLRALALPYADHADYDQAWRP